MRKVADIIQAVIDTMELNIVVPDVSTNGENFDLAVDKTWYLSNDDRFDYGGNKYKVESFTLDSLLTVSAVDHENEPETGTITLRKPQFLHGKVKPTQKEISQETNRVEYYPIIWLYEILSRSKPSEPDSIVDSQGAVRLFFLKDCDFGDWLTPEHYEQVIDPMNTVIDHFEQKLKEYSETVRYFDADRVNHAVFGEYSPQNANDTQRWLLGVPLSGVEYAPDLIIKKDLNC